MFGLDFLELCVVALILVLLAYLIRSTVIRQAEIEASTRLARTRENTRRSIMETRAMMHVESMGSPEVGFPESTGDAGAGGLEQLFQLAMQNPELAKNVLSGLAKPAQAPPVK